MASHWYDPSEDRGREVGVEESRRLDILFDRTLDELLRKPELNSVIASVKALCRVTWFTEDGVSFYLRNRRTFQPCIHLPPSSQEEVILHAQEEYRRMLRYMRLYDRFLQPKIQQIMESDLLKPQKIDRIYWIRLRYPAHVACRVPVLVDGRIEKFCWGWESKWVQSGPQASKSQQRSDRLVNRLFVDTSVLWSY